MGNTSWITVVKGGFFRFCFGTAAAAAAAHFRTNGRKPIRAIIFGT